MIAATVRSATAGSRGAARRRRRPTAAGGDRPATGGGGGTAADLLVFVRSEQNATGRFTLGGQSLRPRMRTWMVEHDHSAYDDHRPPVRRRLGPAAPCATACDGSPSARRPHWCPPTTSTCSTRCAPAPTCAAGSSRSTPRPPTPPPSSSARAATGPATCPASTSAIGVDVDGVRQWRAYSLTHGPRADGCITVTVKAIPDGKVSNHLVHRTRPGTLVHLDQAAGEFVLPEPTPREGPVRHRRLRHHAGHGMLRNLFPGWTGVRADIVLAPLGPRARRRDLRRRPAALAAEGRLRLVEQHTDDHGMLDVADLDRARARPRRAHDLGLRPGRPARRARGALDDRARPDRCYTERFRSDRVVGPARAAPSRSPRSGDRRSRPTARPRSSTPPRTPAC